MTNSTSRLSGLSNMPSGKHDTHTLIGGVSCLDGGTRQARIPEKYQEALGRIPPPGSGGCHPALLGVANLGIMVGLTDGQIFADIKASVPTGSRCILDREILDAISKARREVTPQSTGVRYQRTPVPTRHYVTMPRTDWVAVRTKLIQVGDGAVPSDLWELSPWRPDLKPGYEDALAVFSLYSDHEWLFLGEKFDTTVRPVWEWRELIARQRQAAWPHIMPNPVDGQAHDIGNGKQSYRCDAAVSAFRYVLVEFDSIPKPDQIAFWHSVITKKLLDVALLLDSGGKSIHAWIRVNLPDRAAWNTVIGTQFYGPQGVFTVMGADKANRNPSRLSRLPGHYRNEKKSFQTLLYLNPQKENTDDRNSTCEGSLS